MPPCRKRNLFLNRATSRLVGFRKNNIRALVINWLHGCCCYVCYCLCWFLICWQKFKIWINCLTKICVTSSSTRPWRKTICERKRMEELNKIEKKRLKRRLKSLLNWYYYYCCCSCCCCSCCCCYCCCSCCCCYWYCCCSCCSYYSYYCFSCFCCYCYCFCCCSWFLAESAASLT